MLRSVFVHQNVVHCELISCFDGCKERRVFGKRHSVALGQLQCTRWQRAIPFGVENCNGAPATSEMEMLYTDAGLIRSTCISSRAWSFNVAQLLRLRGACGCNGHIMRGRGQQTRHSPPPVFFRSTNQRHVLNLHHFDVR